MKHLAQKLLLSLFRCNLEWREAHMDVIKKGLVLFLRWYLIAGIKDTQTTDRKIISSLSCETKCFQNHSDGWEEVIQSNNVMVSGECPTSTIWLSIYVFFCLARDFFLFFVILKGSKNPCWSQEDQQIFCPGQTQKSQWYFEPELLCSWKIDDKI